MTVRASMPRSVAAGALLCAILVLGACAHAPSLPATAAVDTRAVPRPLPAGTVTAPIPARRWSGRFSADHEDAGTGVREAAAGRFLLERDAGGTLVLELVSPLGQTVVRARTGPAGSVATLADGRVVEAPDPETLTETVLGWRLPLARLDAWLDGQARGQVDTDDRGRLLRAADAGWALLVDDWLASGLPRRLRLDWPADPGAGPVAGRAVRLRLAVDTVQ